MNLMEQIISPVVGYSIGTIFFVLFFVLSFRKAAALFLWFNLALLVASLIGGAQFFAGLALGVLANRIFLLLPSGHSQDPAAGN